MAPSGSRRRTPLLGAAALFIGAAALLLVPSVAFATSTTAIAGGGAQLSPRVTVAAIDPSLVTGRGAQLGIVEQEAENATTNGTILKFDTSAYTLASEASGRQAVKLAPGQYVAFTLTQRANAMTIRYAIPDAATGGGIDAPLTLSVSHNNAESTHPQTITLTSKYSWLYNQYPFTNDPNAGLLHPDWWITECGCVPAFTTPAPTISKPFRPMHFYDEQRVRLHNTYQPGDVLRLTVPADSNADPSGVRDSAGAFDLAIQVAKASEKTVYIPAGTFQVNRHIVVDQVTI